MPGLVWLCAVAVGPPHLAAQPAGSVKGAAASSPATPDEADAVLAEARRRCGLLAVNAVRLECLKVAEANHERDLRRLRGKADGTAR